MSSEACGIDFQNVITESPTVNILTYEYTYNGGGVAAADFNNDGLCDLYFTGNAVSNRLYINKGDLKFKDVTRSSGTEGRELWKTGVTAADVNADGWMDLYVCYSGPDSLVELSNQLFINNGGDIGGEPVFTEMAKEYGLDAAGTYSTQAAFFDYDRDGDLDMFLINHATHFYSPFVNTHALRSTRHPQFGNRLFRNDMVSSAGGQQKIQFTDVSEKAGIHGGGINFGLGVSISDVNNDGWPDVFVTNDYEEQDFFYLNQRNGTFRDATKESFAHLSRNGMGSDMADYNNDGRIDLIEVDMWPEDNFRQKLLKGPDDYNRYMLMVDSGFHHQQMRNTLQLNAGTNKDGIPVFCEIGQLAGVSSTDWSWAPLFSDFDNDGFKDLFISNGYLRDFTSMDFLKYTVEDARRKAQSAGKALEVYELVSKMPSTKTPDYLFRNNGDLTFSNMSAQWGIDLPNLSFGCAYADLDNDGDQELILNNTNEKATIWLNHSQALLHHSFVQVNLKGSSSNPQGVGSKVFVRSGGQTQMQEKYPTRGFQSSVDPVLHFGLGKAETVDEIVVVWPDGKQSRLMKVAPDNRIEIAYEGSTSDDYLPEQAVETLFKDVTVEYGVNFIHQENTFNDFDREPLIPYQLSRLGPALAEGDVNGDGAGDFYIGGAIGQSGRLYISSEKGKFLATAQQPWRAHSAREDTGATFFDADGDRDLDLFVVSGGNEYNVGSTELDDRLYINDGRGNFTSAPDGSIIADHVSGSCVEAADFDRDGDVDLFVGGRLLPGAFPMTTPGAILRNESRDGKVQFAVATNEVNPGLRQPGMVTDAIWTDFNQDSWPDLIVVGHWMPIRVFINQKGKLEEIQSDSLTNSGGLWNQITEFDYDGDGDLDYIIGNGGLNLPWKVSVKEPLTIYYGDFNDDGRIDPLICSFTQGKSYPIASRDELLLQINSLRKKFRNYSSYATATIDEILEPAQLQAAHKLVVHTLASIILENSGNNTFRLIPLPLDAQLSSVNGMVTSDFNADGYQDLLLAGNYFPYRTQFGPSDAGLGCLLLGDGTGKFTRDRSQESVLLFSGDIRAMVAIRTSSGNPVIAVARNNDNVSLFENNLVKTPKNSDKKSLVTK